MPWLYSLSIQPPAECVLQTMPQSRKENDPLLLVHSHSQDKLTALYQKEKELNDAKQPLGWVCTQGSTTWKATWWSTVFHNLMMSETITIQLQLNIYSVFNRKKQQVRNYLWMHKRGSAGYSLNNKNLFKIIIINKTTNVKASFFPCWNMIITKSSCGKPSFLMFK